MTDLFRNIISSFLGEIFLGRSFHGDNFASNGVNGRDRIGVSVTKSVRKPLIFSVCSFIYFRVI